MSEFGTIAIFHQPIALCGYVPTILMHRFWLKCTTLSNKEQKNKETKEHKGESRINPFVPLFACSFVCPQGKR